MDLLRKSFQVIIMWADACGLLVTGFAAQILSSLALTVGPAAPLRGSRLIIILHHRGPHHVIFVYKFTIFITSGHGPQGPLRP